MRSTFLRLLVLAVVTLPLTACGGGATSTAQGPPLVPAVSKAQVSKATTPVGVVYNGGPVMEYPSIVVDYWGWKTDPSQERDRITNFLAVVGGSSWLNDVTQYDAACDGINCIGDWVHNDANQVAAAWDDATNPVPAAPSDSDVQAEVLRAADATGGLGPYPLSHRLYVVVLPHGHDPSWFGTAYCSFHGNETNAKGTTVAYVTLPYQTDEADCSQDLVNPAPQGNLDNVTVALGHEIAEAYTDPEYTAWHGPFIGNNEIGDLCVSNVDNTPFGGITLGKDLFPVQALWSNLYMTCVFYTPPLDHPG